MTGDGVSLQMYIYHVTCIISKRQVMTLVFAKFPRYIYREYFCISCIIYKYVTKNYQNAILHIVLQFTAYGQNGPIGAIGVPVVLRVVGAWRKGDGGKEISIWNKPGIATFNHVLVCFRYFKLFQKIKIIS